jgi:hypothetical protein
MASLEIRQKRKHFGHLENWGCERRMNTKIDDLFVSPKPSVIIAVNELERVLLDWGLSKSDNYLLIQSRTKPKLPLKYIIATLKAAKELERVLKKDVAKEWASIEESSNVQSVILNLQLGELSTDGLDAVSAVQSFSIHQLQTILRSQGFGRDWNNDRDM